MEVFSLLDSDDDTPARPVAVLLPKSSSVDTGRTLAARASVHTPVLPESVTALVNRKRNRGEDLTGGSVSRADEALLLRERDKSVHDLLKTQQTATVEKLQKQVGCAAVAWRAA